MVRQNRALGYDFGMQTTSAACKHIVTTVTGQQFSLKLGAITGGLWITRLKRLRRMHRYGRHICRRSSVICRRGPTRHLPHSAACPAWYWQTKYAASPTGWDVWIGV